MRSVATGENAGGDWPELTHFGYGQRQSCSQHASALESADWWPSSCSGDTTARSAPRRFLTAEQKSVADFFLDEAAGSDESAASDYDPPPICCETALIPNVLLISSLGGCVLLLFSLVVVLLLQRCDVVVWLTGSGEACYRR